MKVVKHRLDRGAFSGAGRTLLGIQQRQEKRKQDKIDSEESQDVKESTDTAVYLNPVSTNAELNEQFMSPEALELKRKTPMFKEQETKETL